MKEKKEKFNTWRWECIDAEVEYDLPNKVIIYISWAIVPKKNSRQNFGRVSLPSKNYIERHKRIINKLWWREWKFISQPCKVSITTIVWDKTKSDCDNQVASIMDTLTDLWVIEDDNRFIVKEINVKNLWYIKNCWLTRIEITPYEWLDYNLLDEHKGENLLNYKPYFNNLPY